MWEKPVFPASQPWWESPRKATTSEKSGGETKPKKVVTVGVNVDVEGAVSVWVGVDIDGAVSVTREQPSPDSNHEGVPMEFVSRGIFTRV